MAGNCDDTKLLCAHVTEFNVNVEQSKAKQSKRSVSLSLIECTASRMSYGRQGIVIIIMNENLVLNFHLVQKVQFNYRNSRRPFLSQRKEETIQSPINGQTSNLTTPAWIDGWMKKGFL